MTGSSSGGTWRRGSEQRTRPLYHVQGATAPLLPAEGSSGLCRFLGTAPVAPALEDHTMQTTIGVESLRPVKVLYEGDVYDLAVLLLKLHDARAEQNGY